VQADSCGSSKYRMLTYLAKNNNNESIKTVSNEENRKECELIIIRIIITIIIIFNREWVVTRWQWLFYMYTKYEAGY